MPKSPETLYHYCSADSFFKIIESKAIHLSSADCTNDYEEKTWIKKHIQSFVETFISEQSEYKDYCQSLIECFLENKTDFFLACFTTKADILSQWRGYADDGKGFSIGFDRKYFSWILHKLPGIPSTNLKKATGLFRVDYN